MEHFWSDWYQSEAFPDTWYRYCINGRHRESACCREQFGVEIEKR